MNDAMSQSLIEQGFSGDIILDYLDVDTDPMEKFESGYPYRPSDEGCFCRFPWCICQDGASQKWNQIVGLPCFAAYVESFARLLFLL